MASDVRQGPLIVLPSFTIQPEWCDNLPHQLFRTGWDGSGGDGGGGGAGDGASGGDSAGSTGGDTSGSAGSEGGAEGGGPGGTSGDAAGTAGSEGGATGAEGGATGAEGGATSAAGDAFGGPSGEAGGVDAAGVDTSGVDASVAAALGDAGFSLGGLDSTGALAASVSDALGMTGVTAADEAAAFNSTGLGGVGVLGGQSTEGSPGLATGSPGAFASSLASQSDVASPAFQGDEAPSLSFAANLSDEDTMGLAPATTQSLANPDMSTLAPSPQTSQTEEDMGPSVLGTVADTLAMGVNAPTSQAEVNAAFSDLGAQDTSSLGNFGGLTGAQTTASMFGAEAAAAPAPADFGAPATQSGVTAALEGVDQEDQSAQDQATALADAQEQATNAQAAALTSGFEANPGLVSDVDAQTGMQNLGVAAQEMGVAGAPSGLGLTGGQATTANMGAPTGGTFGVTGDFGAPAGTFGVTGDFSGGAFGGHGATGNFGSQGGFTGTFDVGAPAAPSPSTATDVTNMDFGTPTFAAMDALGAPTVSNTGGKGDFLGAPDAQSAALADTFGVAAPTQTADLGAPAPASPGVSTAGPTATQGAPSPATDANQAANPSGLSSPSPAPAQDASVATALADLGLGTQPTGSPGGSIPPTGGGTTPPAPPVTTPAVPGPAGGLPGDVQNQFQQAQADAVTTMQSYFATLGLSGTQEEAQAISNIQTQATQLQSQLNAFFAANPNASTAVQQSVYSSLLSNGGPALQNAVAQAAQRAG